MVIGLVIKMSLEINSETDWKIEEKSIEMPTETYISPEKKSANYWRARINIII